ncbi:MAG: hypothetical protein HY323_07340 [Betaproteobacteria bacterium]|nr:hypothetical protein [Betaproteobacteria bacterium]
MAGTVTLTAHNQGGNIRSLVYTATADAAAATFPDTDLPKIEGRLLDLVTNPGAVAPQDNYDVTVEDQHGHDVLEGVGANRDTANTEKVAIVYSGTSLHPTVDEADTLTLKIGGNNVNSAVTVIQIYYALGG